MKLKALALLLIICLVMPAIVASNLTLPAKADPYIPVMIPMNHAYITSNGTIVPSILPIQQFGDKYVLTGDILNYSLKIEKDNIQLDGNGFTMALPSEIKTDPTATALNPISGDALIQIENRKNIVISNLTFSNFFGAMHVINSSNVMIVQNSMSRGRQGIYMMFCSNCSIVANGLCDNFVRAFFIRNSAFLYIAYNDVLRGGDPTGPLVSSVSFSNFTRNNFSNPNSGYGLNFEGSNFNNSIYENNFTNNEIGLIYRGSLNSNNTVRNNYWGNNGKNISGLGADAFSSVDQSPLKSPVSTFFDSSLFVLPSQPPETAPTNLKEPFQPTNALLVLTIIAIICAIVGLFYVTKKRKYSKKTHV